MRPLDLICNTEEERQKVMEAIEITSSLDREHLDKGDVFDPVLGLWKSRPGESLYERFIKEKLSKG